MAVALFLALVALRLDVLGGAWSVTFRPIELAVPYGLLWVGALWLVGPDGGQIGTGLVVQVIGILRATVLLLAVSGVALLAFDVTSFSRLLIVMLLVAQPAVAIMMRSILRIAGQSVMTRGRSIIAWGRSLVGRGRSTVALSITRLHSVPGRLERRRTTPAPRARAQARPTALIEPPKRWPGLALAEFWHFRRICLVLTRRNLMVRYRQTVVGAAWSLIQPLLLMLVFTVFFGLLGRTETEGLPFPVFYLLGLVPYQMISKILNEGSNSVVGNAALVTRVYFPRSYFPTSVALAALTDLLLALVAVAVLLFAYDRLPGVNLIFAPLFVAIAWFAVLGLVYLLSAINVAYRDVAQLIPFVSLLLMFVSPILYASTIIPESYRPLYFLNPLAVAVEGFRWSLANGQPLPAYAWVLGPAVSTLLVIVGYVAFRHREPAFADYV